MNKHGVRDFLEKFKIEKDVIDEFLQDKHVIKINHNIFLTKEKFKENQVCGGMLLFIQLASFLPSKFLLEFIRENSETIKIKSEKQALNFTYGKNLELPSVEYKHFKDKNYIVTFEDDILGYVEFKDKKFINLMNIGQYLQEK